MSVRPPETRRSGFSLIELLVVVAIVGVLVSLLLVGVQKVREASQRVMCKNNLSQIGLAIHLYHDAHGYLPPTRVDASGGVSWCVLILPFLEEDKFYAQWDITQSFYQQQTDRTIAVRTYFCPTRRAPPGPGGEDHGAVGDYAACAGDNRDGNYNTEGANSAMVMAKQRRDENFNPAGWDALTRLDDVPEKAATFLVGEKHVPKDEHGQSFMAGDNSIYNGDYPWTVSRIAGPENLLAVSVTDSAQMQFGSSHPNVVQFVMCDRSVRVVPTTVGGTLLGLFAARIKDQAIPGVDW